MKRKYERQYRTEWEQNPLFSKWLSKSPEGDNAFCKACNCKILPRMASLKEHENSAKHQKNFKGFSGTPQVSQHFKNTLISEEVKKAEVMIVAALVEHNIPFRAMDHISEILSKAFHDSEIAKKFSCKRTKAAAIAYNVLGANFEEKLREELVTEPLAYSIIIDESTDVSTTKMLAIAIKFFSSTKHTVKTNFLCLIDVQGETAQHLFDALNSALEERCLDWKYMVGFAADTTNVMFGEHAGIVAKMRDLNPHCLYVKCVCHSVALAISHACKLLPRSLEQLVRDVYNYFSLSSKRQREFAEFQDFTETEHHKILRHYDIRWLSLYGCVNRILEQWNPLKLFFQGQFLEDMRHNISSEFLYNCLNDEYLKLYFYFLDYILPLTNKFNTIFQGDYPVVHRLYNDIKGMFLALLSCYMKSVYVRGTDIQNIDPTATMHFLPLHNLYLGVNVGKHLESHKDKMTQQQIHDFFTRCQSFLIDLCSQLKARLPTDRIFEDLTFLNPQTAVYAEFKSLAGVVSRFPNLVPENLIQSIDDEYREMKFDDQVVNLMSSSSSASAPAIDVEQFWEEISKFSKYKNISKFAKDMLILPVSNVKCERIFSEINRIKTKDRNRFINKNVAAILHARQGVAPCTDFDPDANMLKCMSDKILYKDIKK